MILFRCVHTNCALSRKACAEKHISLVSGNSVQRTTPCGRCEAIGPAHARGEEPTRWPDGSPIVLTTPSPRPEERSESAPVSPQPRQSIRSAPRAAVAPAAQELPAMIPTYEHEGEALTAAQWAERIGITSTYLRRRMRRGESIAEIIATPRKSSAPQGAAKPRPRVVKQEQAVEAEPDEGPVVPGAAAVREATIGLLDGIIAERQRDLVALCTAREILRRTGTEAAA